jgi:hypothetical protein
MCALADLIDLDWGCYDIIWLAEKKKRKRRHNDLEESIEEFKRNEVARENGRKREQIRKNQLRDRNQWRKEHYSIKNNNEASSAASYPPQSNITAVWLLFTKICDIPRINNVDKFLATR